MSVRVGKTGDHVQQGTVIYTADNESDIQSLPTTCTPGSTCFCIETSTTYILNNKGEWKVKSTAGGGGEARAYPSADGRSFPLSSDDITFTTLSENYNDIAKAINQRIGTTNTYSPGQMASAIENIPIPTYQQKSITPNFSSGNVDITADSNYDALSQVTIQKDSNLIADNIKQNVSVFGITGSFVDQSEAIINRSIVSFTNNNITKIGKHAFDECRLLTECITPMITSIGSRAFANCKALTSVNFPEVTQIEGDIFTSCDHLTSASLDKLKESVSTNIFNGCSLLSSVNLPKLNKMAGYWFNNCTSMRQITLPSMQDLLSNSLYNMINLEIVDLGNSNISSYCYIRSYVFQNDQHLNVLILRSNTVFALESINSFISTPFASNGSGGTLYVPEALISSYQSASNWSTILGYANNQIKKIEGSIYE